MADDKGRIRGAAEGARQFYSDFMDFRRDRDEESDAIEVDANLNINTDFLKQFAEAVDKFGSYTKDIKNTFSAQAQAYGAGHLAGSGSASGNGRPSSHSSTPIGSGDKWERVTPTSEGVAEWEGTWNPSKFIQSRRDLMVRQSIDKSVGKYNISPGASVPAEDIDRIEQARREAVAHATGGGQLRPWETVANVQPGVGDRFKLPAFGEVQLDEKVGVVSNYLLGQAVRRRDKAATLQESDPERAAQIDSRADLYGNAGMTARYAADRLAPFVTAYRDIKGVAQRRGYAAPTQFGISSGYDAGESVGALGMGFRLPNFSKDGATREGIRQAWSATKLGMQSGISTSQANQIGKALRRDGFTGSDADKMDDYAGQLVKEGWDPDLAATLIGKGMRNGSVEIERLKDAMDNIGDIARTARMDVNQLAQAMDQYAEKVQAAGGQYHEGLASMRSMTGGTGMHSSVIDNLSTNPMTTLMGAVGINGAVDPTMVPGIFDDRPELMVRSMNQAMDSQMSIAGSLGDITWTNPDTGKVEVLKSAEEHQEMYAARELGMSVESFRAWRKKGEATETSTKLLSDIEKVGEGADWDSDGANAALDDIDQRVINMVDTMGIEHGTDERKKIDEIIRDSRKPGVKDATNPAQARKERADRLSNAIRETMKTPIEEKRDGERSKLQIEASDQLKRFFDFNLFEDDDSDKRAKNEGKGKNPMSSDTKSPPPFWKLGPNGKR